jgi:hypothetical protein
MLENNWNSSEIIRELKTKGGIAGLNPTAYAFGLCYSYLSNADKKRIAEIVNKMETEMENN